MFQATSNPPNDRGDIAWYPNLGGGAFGSRVVVDPDVYATGEIMADDLDRDGDADLVSVSFDGYSVAYYENLGGTFSTRRRIDAGGWGLGVTTVELDGDVDPEVVAVFSTIDEVRVYGNALTDNDGDWLTDEVELCIVGTDPTVPDTDGGGVADGVELTVPTHPLDGGDDTP